MRSFHLNYHHLMLLNEERERDLNELVETLGAGADGTVVVGSLSNGVGGK
jgi:hypothetical protein